MKFAIVMQSLINIYAVLVIWYTTIDGYTIVEHGCINVVIYKPLINYIHVDIAVVVPILPIQIEEPVDALIEAVVVLILDVDDRLTFFEP
jgi:hypothetical protein